MARNTGTLITSPIRPNDDQDPIASAFANELKGGHHTVTTITQRNNIIVPRREWGMLCTVFEDNISTNNGTYILRKGLVDNNISNNNNWGLLIGLSGNASETTTGLIRLASTGETIAGINDTAAITPFKLKTWWDNIKINDVFINYLKNDGDGSLYLANNGTYKKLGGFPVNSILYADALGDIDGNAQKFYWNNTEYSLNIGLLGVGTVSSKSDAISIYAKDYLGNGTASPYFLTEDNLEINLRDIAQNYIAYSGLTNGNGTTWNNTNKRYDLGGTLTGTTIISGNHDLDFTVKNFFLKTNNNTTNRRLNIFTESSPISMGYYQFLSNFETINTANINEYKSIENEGIRLKNFYELRLNNDHYARNVIEQKEITSTSSYHKFSIINQLNPVPQEFLMSLNQTNNELIYRFTGAITYLELLERTDNSTYTFKIYSTNNQLNLIDTISNKYFEVIVVDKKIYLDGSLQGLKYFGFGETSPLNSTGVDYSQLVFNSLTPKKYVDDLFNSITFNNGNGTTWNNELKKYDWGGTLVSGVTITGDYNVDFTIDNILLRTNNNETNRRMFMYSTSTTNEIGFYNLMSNIESTNVATLSDRKYINFNGSRLENNYELTLTNAFFGKFFNEERKINPIGTYYNLYIINQSNSNIRYDLYFGVNQTNNEMSYRFQSSASLIELKEIGTSYTYNLYLNTITFQLRDASSTQSFTLELFGRSLYMDQTNKGLRYRGFGEVSDNDSTGVSYTGLTFNALIPKKYADDLFNSITFNDGNGTTWNTSNNSYDLGGTYESIILDDPSGTGIFIINSNNINITRALNFLIGDSVTYTLDSRLTLYEYSSSRIYQRIEYDFDAYNEYTKTNKSDTTSIENFINGILLTDTQENNNTELLLNNKLFYQPDNHNLSEIKFILTPSNGYREYSYKSYYYDNGFNENTLNEVGFNFKQNYNYNFLNPMGFYYSDLLPTIYEYSLYVSNIYYNMYKNFTGNTSYYELGIGNRKIIFNDNNEGLKYRGFGEISDNNSSGVSYTGLTFNSLIPKFLLDQELNKITGLTNSVAFYNNTNNKLSSSTGLTWNNTEELFTTNNLGVKGLVKDNLRYNRIIQTNISKVYSFTGSAPIFDIYYYKGNLWIATEVSGVFVYNIETESIRRFTNTSGATLGSPLPATNNNTYNFEVDNNGYMWVTATNGLWRYDSVKDEGIVFNNTTINVNYSGATLGSTNYRSMTYDKTRNVLYVGTFGSGMWEFNLNTYTTKFFGSTTGVTSGENLGSNNVNDMIMSPDDSELWVGTWGAGVWRYTISTGFGRRYTTTTGNNIGTNLPNNQIWGINIDKNGIVWATAWTAGLWKFNTNTLASKVYNTSGGQVSGANLPSNLGVVPDSDGTTVYVPTAGGGMWVLDIANETSYIINTSGGYGAIPLPNNNLRVVKLLDGEIYVGTSFGLWQGNIRNRVEIGDINDLVDVQYLQNYISTNFDFKDGHGTTWNDANTSYDLGGEIRTNQVNITQTIVDNIGTYPQTFFQLRYDRFNYFNVVYDVSIFRLANNEIFLEKKNGHSDLTEPNLPNISSIKLLNDSLELKTGILNSSFDILYLKQNASYFRTSNNGFGLRYLGFGETSLTNSTGVSYTGLTFNSLTPKKYVDDLINSLSGNVSNLLSVNPTQIGFGGAVTGITSTTNFTWLDSNKILNVYGMYAARIPETLFTSNTLDTFYMYAADYSGNTTASPFFRCEDGTIINLRDIHQKFAEFKTAYIDFIEGDNITTDFVINHNNNTRDLVVQVYDALNNDLIDVFIELTTPNSISVKFSLAPTDTQIFKVIVLFINNYGNITISGGTSSNILRPLGQLLYGIGTEGVSSSANLYFNTDKLGINTSSPNASLEIVRLTNENILLLKDNSDNPVFNFKYFNDSTQRLDIFGTMITGGTGGLTDDKIIFIADQSLMDSGIFISSNNSGFNLYADFKSFNNPAFIVYSKDNINNYNIFELKHSGKLDITYTFTGNTDIVHKYDALNRVAIANNNELIHSSITQTVNRNGFNNVLNILLELKSSTNIKHYIFNDDFFYMRNFSNNPNTYYTGITNGFYLYSNDYSGDGTASPIFRCEDGTILNIRQIKDTIDGFVANSGVTNIVQPTQQILYGTGTGATSSSLFTWNNANKILTIDGITTIKNNTPISNPPTDSFYLYSSDFTGATSASPIFRCEDGYEMNLRNYLSKLPVTGYSNSTILYTTSSGNVTTNNQKLYYDEILGYMGINTSEPTEALYVIGNIYATGDVFSFSDMRFKNNIYSYMENALYKLSQINVVTYTLDDDNNMKRHIGLLAQELENIYPEFVKTPINEKDKYGIKYDKIVSVLIKAIQELKTEIDILKNKN